jgi:hypothetical protein
VFEGGEFGFELGKRLQSFCFGLLLFGGDVAVDMLVTDVSVVGALDVQGMCFYSSGNWGAGVGGSSSAAPGVKVLQDGNCRLAVRDDEQVVSLGRVGEC